MNALTCYLQYLIAFYKNIETIRWNLKRTVVVYSYEKTKIQKSVLRNN